MQVTRGRYSWNVCKSSAEASLFSLMSNWLVMRFSNEFCKQEIRATDFSRLLRRSIMLEWQKFDGRPVWSMSLNNLVRWKRSDGSPILMILVLMPSSLRIGYILMTIKHLWPLLLTWEVYFLTMNKQFWECFVTESLL